MIIVIIIDQYSFMDVAVAFRLVVVFMPLCKSLLLDQKHYFP